MSDTNKTSKITPDRGGQVNDIVIQNGDPDEICDCCGSDLSLGYPEGDGCPYCLPCGGIYSPGTEECDWCKWDSECARHSV